MTVRNLTIAKCRNRKHGQDKLIQRLMATFLEELEEHVRAFNRDLLALEKNPDARERAERLKTLFRTAHSLKGAARSVNVVLIEAACHRLEDILAARATAGSTFHPELFACCFATVDAIEEAGMRLREQQDLAEAPLAALLPRLEAAATGKRLRGPSHGGGSASVPVPAVVPQAVKEVETPVSQPATSTVASRLRPPPPSAQPAANAAHASDTGPAAATLAEDASRNKLQRDRQRARLGGEAGYAPGPHRRAAGGAAARVEAGSAICWPCRSSSSNWSGRVAARGKSPGQGPGRSLPATTVGGATARPPGQGPSLTGSARCSGKRVTTCAACTRTWIAWPAP